MPIQPIDASDVNKLTSGQVIIELQSVIKELVENSLDAQSKQIDITFRNYGIDGVEVTDKGHGIEPSDFESLCLKHHTSKLSSFEDLESVSTLGFRGEALASLCALAKVKITTCTDSTYPKAAQLEYDHMGKLCSQKTVVSGQKSTTVSVSDVFHGLPVRQKYFAKNAKREYSKALSILVSYLLAYTDVRFAIYHISNSGKKSMVMGTKGQGASISDTLVSVYGSNGTHGLIPIDISTGKIEANYKLGVSSVPVALAFRLKGLVSDYSFGMGRGASDRQFLYLNKRPMIHKKFTKIINEVYKTFNHTQSPVFVIDIEIDQTFVDVNVTPDKRSILVQNEDLVGSVIRDELTKFYDGMHNVVPKSELGIVNMSVSQIPVLQNERKRRSEAEPVEINKKPTREQSDRSASTSLSRAFANSDSKGSPISTSRVGGASESSENEGLDNDEDDEEEQEEEEEDEQEVDQEVDEEEDLNNGNLLERGEIEEVNKASSVHSPVSSRSRRRSNPPQVLDVSSTADESLEVVEVADQKELHNSNDDAFLMTEEARLFVEEEENTGGDVTEITMVTLSGNETTPESATLEKTQDAIHDDLEMHASDQRCCSAHDQTFELDEDTLVPSSTATTGPADRKFVEPIKESYTTVSVSGMTKELKFDPRALNQSLVKLSASVKIEKLSQTPTTLVNVHDVGEKLVIQKQNFASMEIIGQFNLGFIVVRHGDRLFIVDQHASDEIYNYERLYGELRLRAQPLVVPRVLELSPIDEMLVLERQAQLKLNGFIVKEAEEAEPGKRVELVALPVSKNVVFDDGDLHELVQRLHELGPSKVSTVRCKKVDSMIAMRACRSSIMVGQVLSSSTMKTVVSHLADLDRPWNCPHGRPTMRHLADLEGQGFSEDYDL